MNDSPDQASPAFFKANNPLNDISKSNCMQDLVVWNKSMCMNKAVLSSPNDPSGRCVVITLMTTTNMTSIIGNRYSSVFN